MAIDIRFPNINDPTDRGQLAQIKSYLYQLAEQLQYVVNNLGTSVSSTYVVNQTPISVAPEAPKNIDEQATFNAIKSLIIKSADIVDSYYDEFSKRLEGEYVATSDFGEYREDTSHTITENSTSIENLFENVQEILTDIENIEYTLIEVNAHIRSGLLYHDDGGVPVYGLEIGQKNIIDGEEVFNKYARFTSDRLSFYDQNDTEVAYISDKKLYIAKVEILYSLKTGGLKDIVLSNGDVVTKWVGTGGDE